MEKLFNFDGRYVQKLQQENAELKADKEEVSKMAVNLERDNQGMAKRIDELEAQLEAKNEQLNKTIEILKASQL
jgi:predicted RNase H-like nuclease (RuvC/YqgF family)